MQNLMIYMIGVVVSLLTSVGFALTFTVVALGVLGPLLMPVLFRDRDSDPFDSAGGATAA